MTKNRFPHLCAVSASRTQRRITGRPRSSFSTYIVWSYAKIWTPPKKVDFSMKIANFGFRSAWLSQPVIKGRPGFSTVINNLLSSAKIWGCPKFANFESKNDNFCNLVCQQNPADYQRQTMLYVPDITSSFMHQSFNPPKIDEFVVQKWAIFEIGSANPFQRPTLGRLGSTHQL